MDDYLEAEEQLLESEETEHSVLGASAAHRWMNCPGSIGLIAKLRGDGSQMYEAGEAAALGTAAHTLAAACLTGGKEPWEFMGSKIDKFVVDMDMAQAVTVYVEHCRAVDNEADIYFTEVPLRSDRKGEEDAFGTADHLAYRMGEWIRIPDYKHGAGLVVEPTYPQSKYYAALAYMRRPEWMRGDREPKFIHTDIVQPRIPHPGGPIRTATYTPAFLMNWWDGEVVPAMAATRDPNALLHVGKWCKFCPARGHCPALKKEVMTFSAVGTTPAYLTDEELGDLMVKCRAIKAYFENDLQPEAFARALQGKTIRHFKVVHKIAQRAWKDGSEAALVRTFGQEAYEPQKLRSPARIEKLIGGQDFVVEHAYKPQTGLTLAPEEDKRTPVNTRVDYCEGLSELL
jgi:hypothetical protein